MLLDENGHRFMFDLHPDGELAPATSGKLTPVEFETSMEHTVALAA